jgi:bleomycin hydrolase
MDRTVDVDELELWRKEFASSPAHRLMQNAVTQAPVDKVAIDRQVLNGTDHTFSTVLDDWKVTNQEHSGRCWLFAGLNLLRVGARQTMGVKEFEFSQNHTMFWDKLERANYLLEAVIEMSDRDIDDRTLAHLLASAADDGGQWNMFVAVVAKHGLVPKAAMPETHSSANTGRMNSVLRSVLRQGAKAIREADGPDAARAVKTEVLRVVHRVLCIHLGTPPERVEWQWTDSDRTFHRDATLSPQEFATRYMSVPLEDYVCLVHDPRPTSPIGRTFTVDHLGNVLGAPPVTYLNVEISTMKEIALASLLDGEPVWFGCDVGKMMSGDDALWDAHLYDLPAVYDTEFTLTKSDRLEFHETQMTHAMLFTGVDVVDGAPRRWRVENSWGKDKGRDGFYTMNDSWFDEYVFEIAARRDRIPGDLAQGLETEPVVLPAWDPMGSLAR